MLLWIVFLPCKSLKGSVNPNFLKHIECCNFQNCYCNIYKSIHIWNGNESENPFLISNFTKNAVFLRKLAKNTFLVKNFCDKLKKNNFLV